MGSKNKSAPKPANKENSKKASKRSRNRSSTATSYGTNTSASSCNNTSYDRSQVEEIERTRVQAQEKKVIDRARTRQKSLNRARVAMIIEQCTCLLIVATMWTLSYFYLNDCKKFQFYYGFSVGMEMILLVNVGCSIFLASSAFRIITILMYICACCMNIMVIVARTQTSLDLKKCDNESADIADHCVIGHYLPVSEHGFYTAVLLLIPHAILLLVASLMPLLYEGSMEHYAASKRGRNLLERQAGNSGKKEPTSKKEPGASTMSTSVTCISLPAGVFEADEMSSKEMTMVVVDKEGNVVGYGHQESFSATSLTFTPLHGEREKKREKQTARVEEMPSRPAPIPPVYSSPTKSADGYNNITKMPPLVSPIAFLSKKSQPQPSEYAV